MTQPSQPVRRRQSSAQPDYERYAALSDRDATLFGALRGFFRRSASDMAVVGSLGVLAWLAYLAKDAKLSASQGTVFCVIAFLAAAIGVTGLLIGLRAKNVPTSPQHKRSTAQPSDDGRSPPEPRRPA